MALLSLSLLLTTYLSITHDVTASSSKISKGDDDRSLFGGFTPPAVRQTSVVFLWYYLNKKPRRFAAAGGKLKI